MNANLFENLYQPQRGRQMVARRKTSGRLQPEDRVLKGREESQRPFRTLFLFAQFQRLRPLRESCHWLPSGCAFSAKKTHFSYQFVNILPDFFFLLLFSFFGFVQAFAQSKFQNLKPEIESLIKNSHAETVAVAVYDLNSKQQFLLNERMNFHAASTMKLPVMMELFRATKHLNFNEPIIVKNSFSSLVDGSEYQLSPDDDSDAELYQKIGQPVPMRELIQRMITRSSNLATNILIEQAKAENVMKLMKTLGANDIQVRRGVEDNKAFRAGLNNTTTAYDLMLLLKIIAEKKLMKAAACDTMISILSNQEFNEGIPAGISKGVKISHKTGSITKIYHDAAIVFPPKRKPYIIVILTRGFEKETEAHHVVAEISKLIWEDFNAKVQRGKGAK